MVPNLGELVTLWRKLVGPVSLNSGMTAAATEVIKLTRIEKTIIDMSLINGFPGQRNWGRIYAVIETFYQDFARKIWPYPMHRACPCIISDLQRVGYLIVTSSPFSECNYLPYLPKTKKIPIRNSALPISSCLECSHLEHVRTTISQKEGLDTSGARCPA